MIIIILPTFENNKTFKKKIIPISLKRLLNSLAVTSAYFSAEEIRINNKRLNEILQFSKNLDIEI